MSVDAGVSCHCLEGDAPPAAVDPWYSDGCRIPCSSVLEAAYGVTVASLVVPVLRWLPYTSLQGRFRGTLLLMSTSWAEFAQPNRRGTAALREL